MQRIPVLAILMAASTGVGAQPSDTGAGGGFATGTSSVGTVLARARVCRRFSRTASALRRSPIGRPWLR